MYNLTCEEVLQRVKSDRNGLTTNQAKNRLVENGKNELQYSKPKLKNKIKQQFSNIIMFVLLFACVANIIAVVINRNVYQVINIAVIFSIIVLNVIIGVVQSTQMEKRFLSYEKLVKGKIQVRRNNRLVKITSTDIVVGDIVMLKAGDIVPADIRLIDANSLFVNDTVITGITMSGEKTPDVIDGKYSPLGERHNMLYMGSSITSGSGMGVVVATGKNTELGKTAPLLNQQINLQTPLTKKVNFVVTLLSFVVLFLSSLTFIVSLINNSNIATAFMVAVSLAVCIVPESLYIAMLYSYSKTMKRLAVGGIITRNPAALENLGNVQVLCVDKGNVLTENRQVVKHVYVANMDEYDLEYNPNYVSLINCMLLCNNTTTEMLPDNQLSVTGESAEKALTYYGYNNGYNKDSIEGIFPRVNILPFDRFRKMMSTLNSVGEVTHSFTRGEYNSVVANCTTMLQNGKPVELTEEMVKKLNTIQKKWIGNGYSVMAFATKQINGNVYEVTHTQVERNMTFVGMCAIYDPQKNNVDSIIKDCQAMGIKVCMLTSDDKESAFLVAKNMGIATSQKQVITGKELDMLTDFELNQKVNTFTVFSRLLSGQKPRIIKALKRNNVVAVTGNNVEDVQALKYADVGIALGESGCEIVKNVADIVTTQDSLQDIAFGVKQSKKTSSNILKMVEYLLSVGLTQLLLLTVLCVGVGFNFFSPATIVWLNFVNVLLPCLGIGSDKVTKQTKLLSNKYVSNNIIIYAVAQAVVVLLMFFVGYSHFEIEVPQLAAMSFVTLSVMQVIQAFCTRTGLNSMFVVNPFGNKLLNWGVVVSLLSTILFVGSPMPNVQGALGVGCLPLNYWLVSMAIGVVIIPLSEIVKLIERIKLKKQK